MHVTKIQSLNLKEDEENKNEAECAVCGEMKPVGVEMEPKPCSGSKVNIIVEHVVYEIVTWLKFDMTANILFMLRRQQRTWRPQRQRTRRRPKTRPQSPAERQYDADRRTTPQVARFCSKKLDLVEFVQKLVTSRMIQRRR